MSKRRSDPALRQRNEKRSAEAEQRQRKTSERGHGGALIDRGVLLLA